MNNRTIFRSQKGRISTAGILYSHLLGQIHTHRKKMTVACDELQRVHPVFNAGRDAWRTHCDFAISSLSRFKEPVQALCTLLSDSSDFPVVLSEHYYPLLLSLCQMSEQGQRLHVLISTYRHVCQSYSPEMVCQKHQIYDALEQLMQCSDDTLSQIEHLINETVFLERKCLYSNEMDSSEQICCEDDQFTTSDAGPQRDNVILLQEHRTRSSHHRSHYLQQARKTQVRRRSPGQKDNV